MGVHPFLNEIPRYYKRADKVQHGIDQRQVNKHVNPTVNKPDQQQQNGCLGPHETRPDYPVKNSGAPYRAVEAQHNKKAEQQGNTQEEILHSVLPENMPGPRLHISGQ